MSTLPTPVSAWPSAKGFLGHLRAQILGVRPVSKKRKALAFAVAFTADLVQIVLWPAFSEGVASPFDDALDVAVAVALCLILGLRARLAFALALELVPGADLFPTWTAVVASIPAEPEPARALARG